jgi:hypothetical protein
MKAETGSIIVHLNRRSPFANGALLVFPLGLEVNDAQTFPTKPNGLLVLTGFTQSPALSHHIRLRLRVAVFWRIYILDCHAVLFHIATVMYGWRLALVALEPALDVVPDTV